MEVATSAIFSGKGSDAGFSGLLGAAVGGLERTLERVIGEEVAPRVQVWDLNFSPNLLATRAGVGVIS